jgi:hypothetical protein
VAQRAPRGYTSERGLVLADQLVPCDTVHIQVCRRAILADTNIHERHNSASLRDGRWRASIDLGYVNGKRKQLSGKTRKGVADKLKAALKEQEAGRNLATVTQTVAGFFHRWLTNVA